MERVGWGLAIVEPAVGLKPVGQGEHVEISTVGFRVCGHRYRDVASPPTPPPSAALIGCPAGWGRHRSRRANRRRRTSGIDAVLRAVQDHRNPFRDVTQLVHIGRNRGHPAHPKVPRRHPAPQALGERKNKTTSQPSTTSTTGANNNGIIDCRLKVGSVAAGTSQTRPFSGACSNLRVSALGGADTPSSWLDLMSYCSTAGI